MKAYVSYVIQGKNGHSHESAIINIANAQFNVSPNPPFSEAFEWAHKMQDRLKDKEMIIITGVYNV